MGIFTKVNERIVLPLEVLYGLTPAIIKEGVREGKLPNLDLCYASITHLDNTLLIWDGFLPAEDVRLIETPRTLVLGDETKKLRSLEKKKAKTDPKYKLLPISRLEGLVEDDGGLDVLLSRTHIAELKVTRQIEDLLIGQQSNPISFTTLQVLISHDPKNNDRFCYHVPYVIRGARSDYSGALAVLGAGFDHPELKLEIGRERNLAEVVARRCGAETAYPQSCGIDLRCIPREAIRLMGVVYGNKEPTMVLLVPVIAPNVRVIDKDSENLTLAPFDAKAIYDIISSGLIVEGKGIVPLITTHPYAALALALRKYSQIKAHLDAVARQYLSK